MLIFIRKRNSESLFYVVTTAFFFKCVGSAWNEDLCKSLGEPLYDIKEGESGTLTGKELFNRFKITGSATGQCSVRLQTCPSCHFVLSIYELKLSPCLDTQACACDHIYVQEPTYPMTGRPYCGFRPNDTIVYASKSKEVIINFLYSKVHFQPFRITFQSTKNVYVFSGSVDSTGVIQSPHFPEKYPADYGALYLLRASTPSSKIQLFFRDFLLSRASYLEVFDTKSNQRLGVFFGETFRPPEIISTGDEVEIRFYANDNSNVGFAIEYTFLRNDSVVENVANTSCGGIIRPYGGVIRLAHETMKYDCVWIVDPPKNNLLQLLTFRVEKFENVAQDTRLEIHKGRTSAAPLLSFLTGIDDTFHKNSRIDHFGPAGDGLYFRLRGDFVANTTIIIVYSAFGFRIECYPPELYQCQNGRCILMSLACDGFDHCGDGSDESAMCLEDFARIRSSDSKQNEWWDPTTPSFIIPVTVSSSNPDIPLLVCSLILIVILMAWIIVMCWLCLKGKNRLSPHQTIPRHFALYVSNTDEVAVNSDLPPSYEAPPTYEDVVKISSDNVQLSLAHIDKTDSSKSNDTMCSEV